MLINGELISCYYDTVRLFRAIEREYTSGELSGEFEYSCMTQAMRRITIKSKHGLKKTQVKDVDH